MNNDGENSLVIPDRDESGSTGVQVAGDVSTYVAEAKGSFDGLPMTNAIGSIGADNNRAFGGPIPQRLLQMSFFGLEQQLRESQTECRRLSTVVDDLRGRLQTALVENATLGSTVKADKSQKAPRTFAIAVGTGLTTFSTNSLRTSSTEQERNLALAGVLVGLVLLLVCWFWGSSGEKK